MASNEFPFWIMSDHTIPNLVKGSGLRICSVPRHLGLGQQMRLSNRIDGRKTISVYEGVAEGAFKYSKDPVVGQQYLILGLHYHHPSDPSILRAWIWRTIKSLLDNTRYTRRISACSKISAEKITRHGSRSTSAIDPSGQCDSSPSSSVGSLVHLRD